MGGYPSQPTPDQIQAILQAPNTPQGPGAIAGPPMPPTPLSPLQVAMAGQIAPTDGNMWDKLMGAVGQGAMPKMPGTTVGAPAGQPAPAQPPPFVPQGPMPRPPGIQALQNPASSGTSSNLMAQYMALQQLMRSS